MSEVDGTGQEPLADGMRIAVRFRHDFVITDAQAYIELYPGTSAEAAGAQVTSAADALFTILERAGIIGDATEAALGGWRAQVVLDDPQPLQPRWNCFVTGDVYALPPEKTC
jgi:hypothetical protein